MSGLRDALETGYDELSKGGDASEPTGTNNQSVASDTTGAVEETPAAPVETQETAIGHARDESGKFVKAKIGEKAPTDRAKKPSVSPPTASPTSAGQAQATGAATSPAPVAAPVLKAPQSWKPGVREKWATLPPEVQSEVLRREKEVTTALQQAAEHGKVASTFQETLRPFENSIRARGEDPTKFVGTLLQTEHALSTGHPAAKADLIAQLCLQYGVEPQHLDRALVARINGQAHQQAPQAPQFQDPRVDKLLQALESQKAERTRTAESEAVDRISKFSETHQFINDIAVDLEALLLAWNQQGKTQVSDEELERAYNIACMNHPDVAPIFEQRKAAEAAQKANASTAKARAAASSVRSSPAASVVGAQPKGLRAALEAKASELGI